MRFAKLHGLGNDFVLVDLRGALASAPDAEFARRVCDRHRGVGADGILALLDAPGAGPDAARLVIHNPDGSRPEMCGNGARCAALWIATAGCTRAGSGPVLLLTDAGPRPCAVEAERPGFGFVEVGMGAPKLGAERALAIEGRAQPATAVSMGNPHRVLFFDGLDSAALGALCAREGPALCAAEDANIEFATALGPQQFAAAVWERGAGATLACGTGACAVAAAAIARGLAGADERVEVRLPGGTLVMRLRGAEMLMRGPAELVFAGELAEL